MGLDGIFLWYVSLALFFNIFVFVYLVAKKVLAVWRMHFAQVWKTFLQAVAQNQTPIGWKSAAQMLLCAAVLCKRGKQTVTFSKKTAYRNPYACVFAPATKIVVKECSQFRQTCYFLNLFLWIFWASLVHKRATMHEKSSLLHKIRGEINQFIYVLNDFGSHKHCLLLVPSLIFDFGTFFAFIYMLLERPPSLLHDRFLCQRKFAMCSKEPGVCVFFLFSDVF